MKITKPKPMKELLIRKLQGFIWRLENTGNGDFIVNGELSFIKNIGVDFANKKFVAFDVGANVGEYTEMILKHLKITDSELHLFEPQKSCFKKITEKFSDNQKIFLNNFGLSDVATETVLYKDFDQSGLASLHKRNLSYYNMEMNETELVLLKTATEYVTSHQIKKINLLKIDIEGHELSALAGFGNFLKPENIDFIQFEYGGANLDSHTSLLELFTFFENRGFILCKMMPRQLEIQSYEPRFENFMYQNWVAVSPGLIR